MIDAIIRELQVFPRCGTPVSRGVNYVTAPGIPSPCEGSLVPVRCVQSDDSIRGTDRVEELTWRCSACGKVVVF